MKKNQLSARLVAVTTAMILMLAICLCGCGGGGSDAGSAAGDTSELEETQFKIAHEDTAEGPLQVYCEAFDKHLQELTDGKYSLSIYTVGQLGDTVACVEQCQQGSLDMVLDGGGTYGCLIPYFNVSYLYYLFPADEAAYEECIANSEAFAKLGEITDEQYNLHPIDWLHEGADCWTANKEIRKPEDFGGVKFRVVANDIAMANYEAFGASCTPMAYTEVYSGLQLGMIDGQVNPLACIKDQKFYEVQTSITCPKCDYLLFANCMNSARWESLPEAGKEAFLEAAELARQDYYEYFHEYEAELISFMEENGCTYSELTDEEIAVFAELAPAGWDAFVKSCEDQETAQELVDLAQKDAEAYK